MMPRQPTVGEIRYPIHGAEDVKNPPSGSLWDIASNGSRLFHPDRIITTPPNSSPLHAGTTLQTPEGDIMFTLSPSGNGSGHLFGLEDGWLSCCVVQM